MKVHFRFEREDKRKPVVYLCNWAVSNPSRFAKTDRGVTCLNCKRIMRNFMINNIPKKCTCKIKKSSKKLFKGYTHCSCGGEL